MQEYPNIMVGVDGSAQAEMALDKAISTAVRNQSTLYIVSVINGEKFAGKGATSMGYGFVNQDTFDDLKTRMVTKVEAYEAKAKAAGVPEVHIEVMIGNAKVELAKRLPQKYDIDLIVMGATGLNFVGRMLVGSTASYVSRMAPCDVIVVRTDQKNVEMKIKQAAYPEI